MFNFLLFDAAKAERNLDKAMELNPLNRSLYKGSAEENLSGVGPYLFAMERGSDFEKWLLATGYGKSWGVFVQTSVSFDECYKHFRKFLMVKTEEGKQLYFRFYDPRVLTTFLPACSREQLIEFFGPVKMFVLEDEDPSYANEFQLRNFQLNTRRIKTSEIFGDTPAGDIEQQDKPAELAAEPIVKKESGESEDAAHTPGAEPAHEKKRKFF